MGAINMLTIPLYLEAQPGMGVKPELRLKENMSSVNVELYILERTGLEDVLAKRCVIMGTRPDGSKLFFTGFTISDWGKLKVTIGSSNVMRMCAVQGNYDCTLTILNTNSSVNENNFMNYDMLTVLHFTVSVSQAARRDADAD